MHYAGWSSRDDVRRSCLLLPAPGCAEMEIHPPGRLPRICSFCHLLLLFLPVAISQSSGLKFKREDVVPSRPEAIRPLITPLSIEDHPPQIFLKTMSVLHESFGRAYARRVRIICLPCFIMQLFRA